MKEIIKKILPRQILSAYHCSLAVISAIVFGIPSRKMIVIGITGTKGKTSTANYIWAALQAVGFKVGVISTANIRIGNQEVLNPFHMTMPGRFAVQKYLKQMADQKCDIAIVETTSQGIIQYRHVGIWYDIAIFTNLSPEHIDSHGSMDAYKKAKGKLFGYLSTFYNKKFNGVKLLKTIIVNKDSEYSDYFLNFKADKKITFSLEKESDFQATEITQQETNQTFKVKNKEYTVSIAGKFNIYNALPAIAIGDFFGKDMEIIKKGIQNLKLIPGRMEEINEGQKFKVFVDYAHERLSMTNALETAKSLIKNQGRVIVILGAEGGGRDKDKGPSMGEIAGRMADIVIVSNTDPYDEDPKIIARGIGAAAERAGKIMGQNLFIILDRREGIKQALSHAKYGDVVIATGMGAQQTMIKGGKEIPWDDRKVVREELRKLNG